MSTFRFYRNNPYVLAAMERNGFYSFAHLATETESDLSDVLDMFDDTYLWPDITTDMVVIAVALELHLTDMIYVDNEAAADPDGAWQYLKARDEDMIATHW